MTITLLIICLILGALLCLLFRYTTRLTREALQQESELVAELLDEARGGEDTRYNVILTDHGEGPAPDMRYTVAVFDADLVLRGRAYPNHEEDPLGQRGLDLPYLLHSCPDREEALRVASQFVLERSSRIVLSLGTPEGPEQQAPAEPYAWAPASGEAGHAPQPQAISPYTGQPAGPDGGEHVNAEWR